MRISINIDKNGTYYSMTRSALGYINASGDDLESWARSFAESVALLKQNTHSCHEMTIHLGNVSDRAAGWFFDKITNLMYNLDGDSFLEDGATPRAVRTTYPDKCEECTKMIEDDVDEDHIEE